MHCCLLALVFVIKQSQIVLLMEEVVLRGFHKINCIILIVLLLDLDSKNFWVFYVQAASKVGKARMQMIFPFPGPK